ncbi:MAG TPA: aldo/keto reductase [Candidatus Methylomirabilis sp.]|nr:aldo/keto reductase [Candidatus Methylomirabilis sp.]
MHYRTLGRTGLRVSEVGFGAWAIGGPAKLGEVEIGWGEVDDALSLRAIEAAYEAGVTFFDTSDAYGAGRSERLLGKALKAKRDRVVIATKVGNRSVDGRWVKDFSREWITQALDGSLARLGMDYVDLYQLHSPTDTADYRAETFEALEALKAQGKIRSYGVSVGPAAHGPWVIRNTRADTIQVVYNLLEREPEQELLALAQAQGVGIIARVPLASGFLTGKFAADVTFPASDHRGRTYTVEKIRQMVGQVARLGFLTEGRRRTLAQAALQYCLSHPAVSTVIPGAKTPEQARANAAASDGVLLTAEEVARVRATLAEA